jgi:UDPglucose 6-dehydrogenase
VWGLAFKPNTDDMREAPSRVIIKNLLLRGAHVSAFDPVASHEAQVAMALDLQDHPEALARLQIVDAAMQAIDGADALLVVTEWKAFHHPDFEDLKARMRRPLILDGRNLYEPHVLEHLGIAYQGIGRRNALALQWSPESTQEPVSAAPAAV